MKKFLLLPILFVLASCGPQYTWDNRPGDIKAGFPAKIVNHWSRKESNGKYGGFTGYNLYVWSQKIDCSQCAADRYDVKPNLWFQMQVGDKIWWEGEDHESVVTDVRYAKEDDPHEDGYFFALEVEQCMLTQCVRDLVSVSPSTWYTYQQGSEIWFEGEPGKVVSQH